MSLWSLLVIMQLKHQVIWLKKRLLSKLCSSLWDQGVLPIDSIKKVKGVRDEDHMIQDVTTRLDWDSLREKVKENGMRNSNVMAIAPTATISNICGVSHQLSQLIKTYMLNLIYQVSLQLLILIWLMP